MYNGLINVYKEPGYTSFDVVAVLRGILKQKKIGHTGTLDPDAEGVLLVCLGNATKLCDMLEDRTKEYECKMLLGVTTDTEDTSGTVLERKEVNVSEEEIERIIYGFLGDSMQIPPMYSALKVNGKKLYELAREGKVIERQPRPINISYLKIKEIAFPYVTFSVSCSKGTYIRSLCRDIGEKAGCGATMEHLTRTRVSSFIIDNAFRLDDIKKLSVDGSIDHVILGVEQVFEELESLYVDDHAKKIIDNGNPLILDDLIDANQVVLEDQKKYKVYNTEKQFVAVYKYVYERQLFMPEKMFPVN